MMTTNRESHHRWRPQYWGNDCRWFVLLPLAGNSGQSSTDLWLNSPISPGLDMAVIESPWMRSSELLCNARQSSAYDRTPPSRTRILVGCSSFGQSSPQITLGNQQLFHPICQERLKSHDGNRRWHLIGVSVNTTLCRPVYRGQRPMIVSPAPQNQTDTIICPMIQSPAPWIRQTQRGQQLALREWLLPMTPKNRR